MSPANFACIQEIASQFRVGEYDAQYKIHYGEVPLQVNISLCEHESQENRDHCSTEMLKCVPTNNIMSPSVYWFICSFFNLGNKIKCCHSRFTKD